MSVELSSYNVLRDDAEPMRVTASGTEPAGTESDRKETPGSQTGPEGEEEEQEEGEPRCEIVVQRVEQEEPPPTQYATDYFTLALFVTLCCCLPLGIVGLVRNHSSRVKAVAGDYEKAVVHARSAFRFSMLGCAIGTACYLAYVIFAMVVLVYFIRGKID